MYYKTEMNTFRQTLKDTYEDAKSMMSFICSCRNKKQETSSIYTFKKVRTLQIGVWVECDRLGVFGGEEEEGVV